MADRRTEESIIDLNTGFIKDSLESTDYTYVDALKKLADDAKSVEASQIKFGIWLSRCKDGNLNKDQIKIAAINSKKNDNQQSLELKEKDVLIPLDLLKCSTIKQSNDFHLELPHNYLPDSAIFPSLAFDGKDDYVRIELSEELIEDRNINLDDNNNFTIEVWVKVASIQPDTQYEDNDIIEKWDGKSNRYPYVIRYKSSSGQIIAARYDGQPKHPILKSKKIINDGEFHHIAFVKQEKTLFLYIDGQCQDNTEDTTTGITTNTSPLYFGCRGGSRNYFKGQIAEVRIWKVPRSLKQLQKYYHERKNKKNCNSQSTEINEKDLVGYWNFKDKQQLKERASHKTSLHGSPTWIDFEYWSPVGDQGKLNSCTAHAGASLLEYFENRASRRYTDLSRLFIYKVARNLMGLEQETPHGASIRQTMAAMEMFGVPPEKYWPNHTFLVDHEPSAFAYGIARQNRVISYCRLDRTDMDKLALLDQIKVFIYAGFPVMFGFRLNTTTRNAARYKPEEQQLESGEGKIPFAFLNNEYEGGHAVIAVGYDDNLSIDNPNEVTEDDKESFENSNNLLKKFLSINDSKFFHTTGAFLIRNSWGNEWGENGYGWLPYAYVVAELAFDWWSLLKSEWLNSGNLGLVGVESSRGNILEMPEERQTPPSG